MVELSDVITVGLLGFGGGVFATLVLVLLVVIYNNIKALTDKAKDDDEDDGSYVMPLSSLLGGGGSSRGLSMADLQAYAAQAKASAPEAPKAEAGGGNYI